MIERNLFKILLTACFAVLLAPLAKAQEGKWQAAGAFEYWVDHLPYNTFEHVDQLDPLVFCASQDNLLIIDGSTDEFSRYSRINGLSRLYSNEEWYRTKDGIKYDFYGTHDSARTCERQ